MLVRFKESQFAREIPRQATLFPTNQFTMLASPPPRGKWNATVTFVNFGGCIRLLTAKAVERFRSEKGPPAFLIT